MKEYKRQDWVRGYSKKLGFILLTSLAIASCGRETRVSQALLEPNPEPTPTSTPPPSPTPTPSATPTIIPGGPADGSYTMTGWTCAGTSLMFPEFSIKVLISNTTGNVRTTLTANSCTVTEAMTLAYPASHTAVVTPGAVSCSAQCSASECTPDSTNPGSVQTLNYALASNVLTLTRTLTAAPVRKFLIRSLAARWATSRRAR